MNLIKKWKEREKGSFIENAVMLYILQFSNMFLGLVTVPYQTRIMGAEIFGKLNVAAAIMMYFQLLMDFGFILSAVAKISRHRDDPQVLSKVLGEGAVLCGVAAGGGTVHFSRAGGQQHAADVLFLSAGHGHQFLPARLHV